MIKIKIYKNNFNAIRFLIASIVLISLISFSQALGVTPGLKTINFEPNLNKQFDFSIVNTEKKDMNIIVYVQGELNQSIYLSENSFFMSAGEELKQLTYEARLPSDLTPGNHGADIVVLQLPDKSQSGEAFVGTALAVISKVNVVVPYPGKYVDADLNINNANEAGEVTIVVPVTSRGNLDIVSLRANIDIYNSLLEKITTINTEERSLASSERAELVANWISNSPPGVYNAIVTVIYDGETVKLEKQFNVGQNDLELQEINVRDFSLGEIAKFEMLVENKWGEVIKGAYAQTQVFDNDGKVMADFKSPTYDVPALTKNVLTSYWDTGGVSVGTYDASIFIRYGEKSSQKDFQFKVSENALDIIGLGYVISSSSTKPGGSSSFTIILIVIVIVLVLLNITWFLMLRKRIKKN